MPKKSRKKRNVTQPRNLSPSPAKVTMKPSSQIQVQAKDGLSDSSRYTSTLTEIKMIGLIAGLLLIGIFVLYFLLR